MSAHLLKGIRPYNEESTDLLIVDGVIAALGAEAAQQAANYSDLKEHDFTGLVALPGLVDIHTHLREPGREDSETVYSGTRAAAAGGYTAYLNINRIIKKTYMCYLFLNNGIAIRTTYY